VVPCTHIVAAWSGTCTACKQVLCNLLVGLHGCLIIYCRPRTDYNWNFMNLVGFSIRTWLGTDRCGKQEKMLNVTFRFELFLGNPTQQIENGVFHIPII
jgi:hypothetical protein